MRIEIGDKVKIPADGKFIQKRDTLAYVCVDKRRSKNSGGAM